MAVGARARAQDERLAGRGAPGIAAELRLQPRVPVPSGSCPSSCDAERGCWRAEPSRPAAEWDRRAGAGDARSLSVPWRAGKAAARAGRCRHSRCGALLWARGRDGGGAALEGGGGGPRRGRGRRARGQKRLCLCSPDERTIWGPERPRRWRRLRPRGSHPRLAAGAHARRLPSRSAWRSLPCLSRAPSSFLLCFVPLPPALSPPFGHSLVPLGARSVEGAIPMLPGSRLRPPESSKRPGSADCGLDRAALRRAPSWGCQVGFTEPPSFSQATGRGRVSNTSVQCGGVREPRKGSDVCAGLCGAKE